MPQSSLQRSYLICRKDVEELTHRATHPAVSIYLNTGQGTSSRQSIRRYLHLLHAAEHLLQVRREPFGSGVHNALEEAYALADANEFWNQTEQSAAIFLTDDYFRAFHLPVSVQEQSVVNGRFRLKPLLQVLTFDATFAILVLSQIHPRLYQASRFELAEIAVPGMPQPRRQVGRGEQEDRPQLREADPFFDTKEARREELIDYLRAVDHAVLPILNHRALPLVLVGGEHQVALYRQLSHYAQIEPQAVEGAPDRLSGRALQSEAYMAIQKNLRDGIAVKLQRLRELEGVGSPKAVSGVEEIIRDVAVGKVSELFVAGDHEEQGRISESGVVELLGHPAPDSYDLLDVAAIQAHLAGAEVYVLPEAELPEGRKAVALLRYA